MIRRKDIGGPSGSGLLLDDNRALGIRRFYHEDSDGRLGVESIQNVTPVVEYNKHLRSIVEGKSFNLKGEAFNMVGRVPMSLLPMLRREGILDDPAALRKWLLNPDNAAWLLKKY